MPIRMCECNVLIATAAEVSLILWKIQHFRLLRRHSVEIAMSTIMSNYPITGCWTSLFAIWRSNWMNGIRLEFGGMFRDRNLWLKFDARRDIYSQEQLKKVFSVIHLIRYLFNFFRIVHNVKYNFFGKNKCKKCIINSGTKEYCSQIHIRKTEEIQTKSSGREFAKCWKHSTSSWASRNYASKLTARHIVNPSLSARKDCVSCVWAYTPLSWWAPPTDSTYSSPPISLLHATLPDTSTPFTERIAGRPQKEHCDMFMKFWFSHLRAQHIVSACWASLLAHSIECFHTMRRRCSSVDWGPNAIY